jgi:dethiobiotin synthetase
MSRYFITGTDTDCGKTYVTCQLLDYFNAEKKRPLALKPIASGCQEINGQLESEDVLALQQHNSDPFHAINGWRFAPAISPHLAAEAAGKRITASDIASFCFQEQFAHYDPLLIEGAGGLMVPLNEKETWIDFLKLTKMQVILVVGLRLGCINHALLTASVLKTEGIEVLGWIANCLDPKMLALEENIETLSVKMQVPKIGFVPYKGLISTV